MTVVRKGQVAVFEGVGGDVFATFNCRYLLLASWRQGLWLTGLANS